MPRITICIPGRPGLWRSTTALFHAMKDENPRLITVSKHIASRVLPYRV